VVLQPYPDGITTRRTSTMASLALGVPVITNAGALTEPLWYDREAVALAPSPTVEALVETAERVLNDPAARASLGARGRELHDEMLSMDHAVRTLRDAGV
jgi:glycosyltransferase involved in cell wall biosynthesis